MSYINNMNPRRMIWFNQNAPKNKMDLWLSYNRHYEDMSEDETTDPQQTTDNPNQRKCDLILKAWDCGKWIPIVGFNTTAANKIDTVTGTQYTPPGETNPHNGKTLYHPAVFTAESPNELFDWGSLGDMLKNELFVTNNDWGSIYNTRIKNLVIQDIDVDIDPATDSELGGIYASRFDSSHTSGTSNSPYIAQCKYKFQTSQQTPDYNLFVHAKDIISAVNNLIEQNPNEPGIQPGSDFDLWLATTSKIGGIRSDTHSNVQNTFKPVECKFYPTTWSQQQGRLCVNAKDVVDTFIDSLDDNYPLLIGGPGIEVDQVLDHSQIQWKIVGLANAQNGQYPRCKINSQQNHTLEWVDSVDTWRPIQVNGQTIAGLDDDPSGNTVNLVKGKGISISTQSSLNRITPIKVEIDVNGAEDGQVLSYNSTTQDIEWVTPQDGSYTEGIGVQIDTQNSIINSEVLIDNTSHTASTSIEFECAGEPNNGYIKTVIDNNINSGFQLHPFKYTLIGCGTSSVIVSFTVGDQKIYMKGDPVFVELDLSKSSTKTVSFGSGSKWIIADECIQMSGNTGSFKDPHVLVTIQFGVVKIEPIQDYVVPTP